jgi:hypothetical protein
MEHTAMKIEQQHWTQSDGWVGCASSLGGAAQLVLIFAGTDVLRSGDLLREIKSRYPKAVLLGCSTAGEICGTRVRDDSLAATAVHFEHTRLKLSRETIGDMNESQDIGARLARSLAGDELTHVLVLSDGLKVNGSELVKGLRENLPEQVSVTGGLAGDGARFQQTLVCADDAPAEGAIAALGFYGTRLKVGYGSLGGWDSFGPERLITKSKDNVLYELDGQSALELYKRYLGEHAAGLPATALLFPLSLRVGQDGDGLVRTILAVDEEVPSMTFAGDMPEGAYARLMKANFDRLIDGAANAAHAGFETLGGASPDLAILISCVGRKLVLKQRIEEEVEGVRDVLGEGTVLTGFYSYGEICPHGAVVQCQLHNQTMTITTFSES